MADNFEVIFFGGDLPNKLGDTVYVHYFHQGNEFSFIYDCGSQFGMNAVVGWMKKNKREHVDAVIFSHADKDHTEFGAELINKVNVSKIWLNRPWTKIDYLFPKLDDGRITIQSLEKNLREKYEFVHNIEQAALQKGVPIIAPLPGAYIGLFRILSPSLGLYLELLEETKKTPEIDTTFIKSQKEHEQEYVTEKYEYELLDKNTKTDPENEMSLVLSGILAGKRILLTGDAGGRNFNDAFRFACEENIAMNDHYLVQIPHHGSRHNLNPDLMDHLFGVKYAESKLQLAVISAPHESPDHPHGSVVNAAIRRNTRVYKPPQNGLLMLAHDRQYEGFSDAKPLEFMTKVKK